MKLEYRLAANDKGVLEIHDVTGHLVATYGLNPASSYISFTNNELSNGVYFYRLNVNGKIMHSDKLVIVK